MRALPALLLVAACAHTTPPPPAPSNSTVASVAAAPAVPRAHDVVLRWKPKGEALGIDDIIRKRLDAAHIAGVSAFFRGPLLEVTIENATLPRVAIVQEIVERPLAVHLASGTDTFALDADTLADVAMGFDPVTARAELTVAVTPAAAAQLASFTTHAPLALVADGKVLLDDIQPTAVIEHGRFVLDFGGASDLRDAAFAYLRAARSVPLVAAK
jgi:hypothetical protein